MRYIGLLLWWGMVLVLAGCGTNSKVDKFISSYGDTDVIQKPIENFSGANNDDLLSEQLLLWWASDTPNDGYGIYTDYTANELQSALSEDKNVVLVVVEPDCDNCTQLDQSMSTALSRIPVNVVVMRMSFAQAQSAYKVIEQNSVIYLNSDGSVKYVSDGGIRTVDNLVYYL